MSRQAKVTIIFLALLLTGGLAWYFTRPLSQEPLVDNTTDVNTPAADTEQAFEGFYVFNDLLDNDLVYTQQIPDAWEQKELNEGQKPGDPFPKPQLALQFSNSAQSPNEFSISNLVVYDLTDWLGQNTTYDRFGSRVTVSAKQKSDHFARLENLRNTKDPKSLTQCTFGFFDPKCYGKRVEYFEAANGKLAGYSSLEVSHQSFDYFPFVNFELAGTVNGRKIYIVGVMQVYDVSRRTLGNAGATEAQITAAINKLSGELDADTKKAYDEILTSFKSISLK